MNRSRTMSGLRAWRMLPLLLVVVVPLLLAGCDDEKSKQIDWQLPLAAPEDAHGASANQNLPAWAEQNLGGADLVLLQKNTARLFSVHLDSGMDVTFKDMHFRLLGLAEGLRVKSGSYIDDKNVHNPAAFVEISQDERQIYRGWLYQEFPELFGPDMENWKVSLHGIQVTPVPDQAGGSSEDTTGTRP